MAKKVLEETKEIQTKVKKQNSSKDDIYKFDFGTTEEPEKIVQNPPKSKRGRKKKIEKTYEFDDVRKDEMIASIDSMREKIEQSQKMMNELTDSKKSRKDGLNTELDAEEINEEKKTRKKRKTKEETNVLAEIIKKETRKRRTKAVAEESQDINKGIKINAKDGVTDVFLDENQYRIEMQKTEYNLYTKNSGSSYIIVRDSEIRVISGDVYLVLHKDHQLKAHHPCFQHIFPQLNSYRHYISYNHLYHIQRNLSISLSILLQLRLHNKILLNTVRKHGFYCLICLLQ